MHMTNLVALVAVSCTQHSLLVQQHRYMKVLVMQIVNEFGNLRQPQLRCVLSTQRIDALNFCGVMMISLLQVSLQVYVLI
jgi:hypothetical protein